MNKVPKYGLAMLVTLYMGFVNHVYGQFLTTRISLPAGVEIVSKGATGQIKPQGAAKSLQEERILWIELRAMVNLQLVVDHEADNALIPIAGDLTVLNDGTQNFTQAKPINGKGFVLIQNPRQRVSRFGIRPYSAWLGIPFQSRGRTTIHYP